ncbi:TPA: hypothetical protein ACUNCG_000424 [Aeromonas hydrophila]
MKLGYINNEFALNDIKSKLLTELQNQNNEDGERDEYYINGVIDLYRQCNERLVKLQEQRELAELEEQKKLEEEQNNNNKENE